MKTLRLQRILNPDTSLVSKDATLLIFRVLISLSLINTHGLKKVLNFEETLKHIPDPFGMGVEFSAFFAVFANVICPIFLILGLGTRLATIPILAITLSGFFIVHSKDPWPVRDVPLMYSLAFGLLFILGPGRYSIDHRIKRKEQS